MTAVKLGECMNKPLFRSVALRRLLFGLTGLLVVLVLAVLFFPWDAMRGPIGNYVSGQLGRRFEITQHLSVNLGKTTTVRAEGVEFANPAWARDPYLLKASAAEFEILLWPLLFGKLELPRLSLVKPQIGLQLEPDGRRTWSLSRDNSDPSAIPKIGSLVIDQGTVKYRAVSHGADLTADLSLAAQATQTSATLPLGYKVVGKWKNEEFAATGRTGGVLQFNADRKQPFPIEIDATAGKTTLKAKGTVENLLAFAGLDATIDLQGRNLAELYKWLGVVLPSTPPYKLRGRLTKRGQIWSAGQINGVLGKSDISGDLGFDTTGIRPMLSGKVQSKVLDFADLAPVIGLPVKASASGTGVGSRNAAAPVAPVRKISKQTPTVAPGRVLPSTQLDLERLQAMNADVTYIAADIRHVEQLPLDKGSAHIRLTNGVLRLDPVSLGVAGGTVAGRITIDANMVPAAVDTRLDLRAINLNQLFPTIKTTQSSFGKIGGQINLKGRGNSAAQMLGNASGDAAVLMGRGEISNILMEFMGLDGGEIIKFLIRGDRNVQLRCAAAAFDVKQGLMRSKTILLDTADTVIHGSGQISLADETLDLVLSPEPKDQSILSLRSPLKIGGTFAAPTAGPDKAALAGRAGIAIALGVINPLLALLGTIETGPGQDADCRGALAVAADPKAKAAPRDAQRQPASRAVQGPKG